MEKTNDEKSVTVTINKMDGEGVLKFDIYRKTIEQLSNDENGQLEKKSVLRKIFGVVCSHVVCNTPESLNLITGKTANWLAAAMFYNIIESSEDAWSTIEKAMEKTNSKFQERNAARDDSKTANTGNLAEREDVQRAKMFIDVLTKDLEKQLKQATAYMQCIVNPQPVNGSTRPIERAGIESMEWVYKFIMNTKDHPLLMAFNIKKLDDIFPEVAMADRNMEFGSQEELVAEVNNRLQRLREEVNREGLYTVFLVSNNEEFIEFADDIMKRKSENIKKYRKEDMAAILTGIVQTLKLDVSSQEIRRNVDLVLARKGYIRRASEFTVSLPGKAYRSVTETIYSIASGTSSFLVRNRTRIAYLALFLAFSAIWIVILDFMTEPEVPVQDDTWW
ncbi:uncharacterized protein NEMAJ01_0172 [Nematocida major]|uniref:uncharacterized protein n=1 Tax=Nematocida major TaxID=1912982 RepID=UPI00200724CF|nr:uncharacterized protein NEMAJ01_0172 [Nematocida major]KAH9385276.1 hypothetical protein NEMAJ01_0172 [Nematocida major]